MLKPPKHILSKSTFMYGCQCPKRLWLHKYMPSVKDEEDEEQQAIFQSGTNVGKLAEELFTGGVDARPKDTYSYQQSVADTAKYIAAGHDVIYEAAFQYNGLLCAVDILVKKNNQWYAYEVKSTTSVHEKQIPDAAFQYYVITNAGLTLTDFSIIYLNNKYVRKGPLNIPELFTAESVLGRVQKQQAFIHDQAIALKTMLSNKTVMPIIEVGDHCNKPYPCDFQGYCYMGIVEEKKDYGKPYVNKEAVREFIEQIEYPIYHMDFESWMTAVPEYDGHWPYRQICFQYSVHKQVVPNGDIEHHHYLAEGTHSTSLEFLENLLNVLGNNGTVLVYSKGFEMPRLKELANEHPQYYDNVQNVLNRVLDLMAPFRKNYRTPEMEGRWSIKKVLPALVPELSYNNLMIGNGGDASAAFYNLGKTENEEDVMNTRKALLEYCGLDTLAMVRLLEVLKNEI